ncbi:1-aminocyclopropane-1-carboxylate deaminase/D-cysteine desulfhydrase [Lacihabitans sp. LS3-19]|uniref:1-aminocyclopropane-1-carboxylate deaminase/D-cysteine desulfhydrase n=1 Tax=Lacihabitans sp. LS3-19 TaxID=2487335 RepID=UPI0020CE1E8D|nr:pyridoxal-phosphate dependent enzyme [Lacihabitans sp. LS3-19]MCP9767680.1 1-aminocyclopropane-1-carboxylate deaminase/D-cysteine desulfhydrase [Lacihabitans sp. LS3-19]
MLEFERIINIPTPIVQIFDDLFEEKQVEVFVKRDDLTHEHISGNKFRKLKYNLLFAKNKGFKKLATFGGAYSNHIAAFAEACALFGFEGLGIIRGDELNENSSPTLKRATERGMKFTFVSRTAYRDKDKIAESLPKDYFIIPEGGTNTLALPGVGELINELNSQQFDYICTAVGTGGTMAGLLSNHDFKGKIIGVAVLKNGDFLRNDISGFLNKDFPENVMLETEYHFGGYGKHNAELLDFIKTFEAKHQIPLDQVYTGKMFYSILEKIKKGDFEKGSRILLIHTGGLQGKLRE